MHDEAGTKTEPWCDFGVARLTTAEHRTGSREVFRASCPVDGAVDSSATSKGAVGGVDHCVDLEGGDVSEQGSDCG